MGELRGRNPGRDHPASGATEARLTRRRGSAPTRRATPMLGRAP